MTNRTVAENRTLFYSREYLELEMKQITCAAIQFNICLGNIDANLDKATSALKRAAERDARLAVLPEMWSCGYDYRNLNTLAAQTPRVLDRLQEECRKLNLVSVGSLPELQDGTVYNTAYVIDKGELVDSYRKLHLFSTMREDQFLGAGERAVVAETSLGRLGIAICYDLRFPELFRKLALAGAEIICLPAEWPKPRQEHWKTLLRARAIENQLFVIAANCCGRQDKLDFFGLSQLISPLGTVLEMAGEVDTELVADFDFREMEQYRAQIKTLDDRRADIYGTP
jgi:predicted amidohydrolase